LSFLHRIRIERTETSDFISLGIYMHNESNSIHTKANKIVK